MFRFHIFPAIIRTGGLTLTNSRTVARTCTTMTFLITALFLGHLAAALNG